MAATASEIPDVEPPNITARVLAPVALVACVLALFLLVSGTLSGDGDGGGARTAREPTSAERGRGDRPELGGKAYVVQPGDTLTGIAARAGVPLDRLERRNPDVDPAALNAGQQLRLR